MSATDLANATPDALVAYVARQRATRENFLASLQTETGNRTSGPFRRLSIEETRRRDGCVGITSHPFALVLVGNRGVIAAVAPSEPGKVNFAPYSARLGFSCITAEDVAKLRGWAEEKAAKLTEGGAWGEVKAEAWAVDALRHYGADLVAADKEVDG